MEHAPPESAESIEAAQDIPFAQSEQDPTMVPAGQQVVGGMSA